MKKRLNVSYKLGTSGEKFYYVDMGSESHGRPSFRLWISSRLIKREKREDGSEVEYIEFPARARIVKTEKGTLVLKPSDDHVTHYIYVKCGFRGGARAEIEAPKNAEIYRFAEYHSPKGALGADVGYLIVIPAGEKLIYRWYRTGRLYGQPAEGRTLVAEDGSEIELSEVEDELREMLKGEGE